MGNDRAKIDEAYRKALNAKLGGAKGRKAYVEAVSSGGDAPAEDPKKLAAAVDAAEDEPKKPIAPEAGDEGADDPFDEADSAMEDVDLDEMSSEGKLELIRMIIDSEQNAADDDEKFSEFMNGVLDIMDEFQIVGDDEPADEPVDEPTEEPTDEPAEEPTDEPGEDDIVDDEK